MEYRVIRTDELSHHGILGQKWGVRRYQNADGTWTDEGKKRYSRQSRAVKYAVDQYNNREGRKPHEILDSSYKAQHDLINAFPELKRKLNDGYKTLLELTELHKLSDKEYRKQYNKIYDMADDYYKSVDKIFKPFKESIPNYDRFIMSVAGDYEELLYAMDADRH